MNHCNSCKKDFRGETGLCCAGVCNKMFHPTEKCCGLDKFCINAVENKSMIKFICDDCIQLIHNVDYALKDIQLQVKKSGDHLKEYRAEFDHALHKNELEIKNLLEAIEGRFSERLEVLQEIQDLCSKNVNELSSCKDIKNTFLYQSEKICKDLETNKNVNERMIAEIKKVTNAKESNVSMPKNHNNTEKSVSGAKSFAAAVRASNRNEFLSSNNDTADSITIKPSSKTPEWTTVVTRKKKKHSLIGAGVNGVIEVVSKFKWLHISSFKNTVSEQDVINFLSNSTGISVNNFLCFKLVKKDADVSKLKFINFKLGIVPNYYAEILNPVHWPANVRVRPFDFVNKKKNPPTDESEPSDGTEPSAGTASSSSSGTFLEPTVVVRTPSPPDRNAS